MPRRFPIKAKLALATLIPMFVAIASCWLVGVFILNSRVATEAQGKVRNNLNAAHESYRHELETLRNLVRFTAAAPSTIRAVENGDREALAAILPPLLRGERLDIFTAVDAGGAVIFRGGNPPVYADSQLKNPFVARALAGELLAGADVVPLRRLTAEGKELARRSVITRLPTPHARPAREEPDSSGMVMMAAAPIRDTAGNVVGALYAGVLLNNNNLLVDRIQEILFGNDGENASGRSTIFLGDLRIATNVKLPDGKRAIGTRMSEEVYAQVLLRREKWFGRAFVVNDWFFSAYEPILSLTGIPIGALYVGIPERPYTVGKLRMGFLYSGVLLIGTLLGLAVSHLLSARLAAPIGELERLARRVAAGERGLRIEVPSRDEIGDLAMEFSAMTKALTRQEEEIRDLNRELEQKVRERTVELEEQGRQLLVTREELFRVEKLAAVGELAAGVAHEINNPLAIIRGNAELLEMELPLDSPSREEVAIINRQVGRVERIVSGLLHFARRKERQLDRVDLHQILNDVQGSIGHQVSLDGITLEKEYDLALPGLDADGDQLRQLFANLMANAAQAMPDGGTLTLTTRFTPTTESCTVTIADTGNGIAPDHLSRIFNPFFTTKGSGTGLGLSISYGIVREHGGSITATNNPGDGALFTVTLPCKMSTPPDSLALLD